MSSLSGFILFCMDLEQKGAREEKETERVLELRAERIWLFIAGLDLESLFKGTWKSLSQLRSSCSGGGGVPMEGVNLTLSKQSSDQTHLVMPYTSLNYILEIALHLTVTKLHASYFVFHSIIKQDSFSWVWSLQELHLLTNSPSNLCCVLMYYSDRLHHACNPS